MNFASNGLATIIGAAIGIPIAFYVERKLESIRQKNNLENNKLKIEDLLYRALIQITNLEVTLQNAAKVDDKNFLIFTSLPEVEIIESLHKLLSDLDTDWEILLSIDFIISDSKSLISFLDTYRGLFLLLMGGKISPIGRYSLKFYKEFEFRGSLTLEAIKDFRKIASDKYPHFMKHLEK